MASETINIGKLMRSEAWVKKGKRKTKRFRVSPDAVQEMIGFIKAGIAVNIPQICELAESTNHPNTVKSVDVIRFFGKADSNVFEEVDE